MTSTSDLTLFIDTSSGLQTSLISSQAVVMSNRQNPSGRVDSNLGGMVEECLEQIGAGYHDIQKGMVCTGPGSFTGLRIGIAYLQGICFPRSLPIYTFSSLRAMVLKSSQGETGALMPARKDHFYFLKTNATQPDSGTEEVITMNELPDKLVGLKHLVTAGNSEDLPSFVFKDSHKTLKMQENYPYESIFKYALSNPIDNGIIKANYIQKSAAEINLGKLRDDSGNDGK